MYIKFFPPYVTKFAKIKVMITMYLILSYSIFAMLNETIHFFSFNIIDYN